jgi:hypothetical protein
MRSVVRLILINAAVFIALVGVGAVIVVLLPGGQAEDARTGKAALPNYDGIDWITRYSAESDELALNYYSYLGWRRKLFSGDTINVVGDFRERRTAEPPNPRPETVFFFGGSTMWGTGSRDADTIPSHFALKTGLQARNFGETAYTAHQNLEMLIKLLQGGERPAAVVFYDGVNDVEKCRRELNYFSDAREPRTRLAVEPSGFYRLYGKLVGKLATLFAEQQIAEEYDCDSDPQKAAAVAGALVSDWKIAAAVAHLYGARFYAFLQPVIYYSDTKTDYLKIDLDSELSRQFRAVYPRIRELMAGTSFRDLTDAFDRDEPIYIDYCHVSPNGNAMVAARLADVIMPDIVADGGA